MAHAIAAADLDAICDAIACAFFGVFNRTMDAEACEAGAARHAAEAAACARQAASATSLPAAAGADSAFPFGGSRTHIRDIVSARQRKWIEDRIDEKLRD